MRSSGSKVFGSLINIFIFVAITYFIAQCTAGEGSTVTMQQFLDCSMYGITFTILVKLYLSFLKRVGLSIVSIPLGIVIVVFAMLLVLEPITMAVEYYNISNEVQELAVNIVAAAYCVINLLSVVINSIKVIMGR